LFFLTIFFIIIPRFKENIMLGKRQTIEELTRSASSILEKYESDERNGLITREEAQRTAISRIQYLRYGAENKDYFWITDMKPDMVMHPYRSDLNGKSLREFSDPHGKKLFVEMVNVCRRNGQGYVEYMWQWKDDSLHIVPKLSYVKEFEPWGWIIGTGIYIEDVKKEIVSLTRRLLTISLGISLVIALLLTYITVQSLRIERKRRNAESQLRISREKYKTLVDATTEGLIMMLDQKMVFSNNKIHDLTGFTENELASQPFSWLLSEQNNPETITIFQNRNLPDGRYEVNLSMKNGDQLDSIVTISSIFFAEKKGKLITIKDASVHKTHDGTTEDILEILELAGQGFIRILLDAKGKILYASKTMVKILGFSEAKELSHYSILDFFADPAERKRYRSQLLSEGLIKKATIRLKRRDGSICVVTASLFMLKNESQELLCDGIIEDITKRTAEIREKNEFISRLQVHTLLLQNPVEQFIVPVTEVQMDATVARVIDVMKKKCTDVVLVTNRDGAKIGIITAGDISERVLMTGLDLQHPAYEIMSAPLVSVSAGDTLQKAITLMQDAGISCLAVKNSAASTQGLVHSKEISRLLYNSFSFIENDIDNALTVEQLTTLYNRFLNYLSVLSGQSVNPVIIGKSIASVSDRITSRLIRIAIEEFGAPPVEFAFIALGSEGRMEQTLATDQDNAIIYADVPATEAERVQTWFNSLGEFVCDQLNTVGYKYCKGRVMAKNPLWCKPLQSWKNYFSLWISTPEPKNLLDVSIFFDLRAIFGNTPMVDELRRHIDLVSDDRSSFFYNLADSILSVKPSLGMTGALHVDKKDNKELFDLKIALTPYISFARIYALFHKVSATNTLARIQALYETQAIPLTTLREFSHGYEFLMMMRYKHQVAQREKSEEVNNLIDLQGLLEVEEFLLKKTLSQVADFQNRLNVDFKRSVL
jgi:PAS domain S-box-containing protein